MTTQPKDWQVLANADDVAQKALDMTLEAANKSIAANGSFHIVLAGGTTPMHIYRLLSEQLCDWKNWYFYIGDERCLPVDDSERNSEMIRINLLDKIDVPAENIIFMATELGAEKAADAYKAAMENAPVFDLVMLGMGEDGHTASLFPGHENDPQELVHAVYESPKPPSDRVSMSAALLSKNTLLMLLITGKGKQTAVQEWKAGVDLPITRITSQGKKVVLLDEAAAV